jgi:hypothetical protein
MPSTPFERHQGVARPKAGGAPELPDLLRVTALLGQLDLGDPRLGHLEPLVDLALRSIADIVDEPRSASWRAIADDPSAPLVVKLRALGRATQAAGARNRLRAGDATPDRGGSEATHHEAGDFPSRGERLVDRDARRRVERERHERARPADEQLPGLDVATPVGRLAQPVNRLAAGRAHTTELGAAVSGS